MTGHWENSFVGIYAKNSFVVPTKIFAISIKFWLLKQNVLLGQQNVLSGKHKKFCCIHFFLSGVLKWMVLRKMENTGIC